jgi:hypothetical protein
MKFDKEIDKFLKQYPLNEDFGSLFSTLGQMVKNKVKYILEPMTEPFNQAKPDLSKGDDIIIQVADNLIEDQTNSNKKLKFFKNDDQIPPKREVSYNDLQNPSSLRGKNPNYVAGTTDPDDPSYNAYFDYSSVINNIIKIIDLNKLNLNISNPVVKQKIKEVIEKNKKKREEYGEEQTRADISADRLYQRYEFLIKGYFKPFSKNLEEKTKWLYILAKDKQEIKFSGKLPTDASTTTPSTSGTPTPTSTRTPTRRALPTPTPTPTPTRTPRTRPPAPPTRVVRPSRKP